MKTAGDEQLGSRLERSKMFKILISILFFTCFLATGCTQTMQTNKEEIATYTRESQGKSVVIHSTFGSSDISSWQAPDNQTLIIDTFSHGKLVARFRQPCSGIRTTEVIGFDTMGPFDLDRSTRVILPDGRQCWFKTLTRYIPLEKNTE